MSSKTSEARFCLFPGALPDTHMFFPSYSAVKVSPARVRISTGRPRPGNAEPGSTASDAPSKASVGELNTPASASVENDRVNARMTRRRWLSSASGSTATVASPCSMAWARIWSPSGSPASDAAAPGHWSHIIRKPYSV